MRKIFILLFIFCFVLSLTNAQADLCIKRKSHQHALVVKGQQISPTVDSESVTWIAKNKAAIISENKKIIYNKFKKKMYIVHHKKQQYVEMDIPLNMQKYIPKDMEAIWPSLAFTVKEVKALDIKKNIKGWDCQAYRITIFNKMQKAELTLWTTKDIPDDLKDFKDMEKEMIKFSFPMNDENYNKLSTVEGYEVLNEITLTIYSTPEKQMELKITGELVDIEEKKVPAGIFDIPKDYKKLDRFRRLDMQ